PALKEWMDREGVDAVYLAYFGTDRPEAYGIPFRPLPGYGRVGPPGGEDIPAGAPRHVVAVSANHLLGLFLNDPETYSWLRSPAFSIPKDFLEYWASGRLSLRGENPYDPATLLAEQRTADPDRPEAVMMWNPPPALALYAPLGWLSPRWAALLWIGAQLLAV